MKPRVDLLKPSETHNDLRVSVIFKASPLADEVRSLAESYQLEPAAVVRMLVAQALKKAI